MRSHIKHLFLLLLVTVHHFFTAPVFGQDTAKTAEQGSGLFLASPSPSDGDYLQSIGRVYGTLNRVRSESVLGFEVHLLEKDLDASDSTLSIVQENLSRYQKMLNLRNLQMFQILLGDLERDLQQALTVPQHYDKKLTALQNDIAALRNDSILLKLVRDTTLRKSYLPQLMAGGRKWMQADSAIKASLTVVNRLESRISSNAILTSELQNQVREYLSKTSIQTFGKELNYLWEPAPENNEDEAAQAAFQQAWQGERKALRYYFDRNGQTRWVLFFSCLGFFGWVTANFRRLRKAGQTAVFEGFSITYLSALPIAATLVFVLSLAPIFDLHPPAAYLASMQLLLMVALTFLYWRRWSWQMLAYWGGVLSLFLLFSLNQVSGTPNFGQRVWMLALNGGSVLFGLLFLYRARKALSLPGFVRIATLIFIFLNLLAVFCNLWGRFTLARIFSSAAIFGLAQSIGLAAFVQIGVEALLLQIQRSRLGSGLSAAFDQQEIEPKLRRLLSFVAWILWALVLAANLNIYSALYDGLTAFLNAPRSIGTTSFQFSSVVTFFSIIWIANLLQRYTGYFFGDTDDEQEVDNKGKRSRLLIWRLVLLSAGFLLAVAASGLPIDKLTIVLGALGVGIGLGLQNIVHNLVSGVILIFERPLQIGDTVEIGDRKGKVKGIGIRSSKLLTPEGAEVIVPNGDLLSQHIVNWTLSDNHVRIDLPIHIAVTTDLAAASALIVETLSAHPQVLKKQKPVVMVHKIGADTLELSARFWCADINKVDLVKSELRLSLGDQFAGNKVVIQ